MTNPASEKEPKVEGFMFEHMGCFTAACKALGAKRIPYSWRFNGKFLVDVPSTYHRAAALALKRAGFEVEQAELV